MKKKTSTNTSGEFYLGYSRQELLDVSWYQLLHWDFMREAQSKHRLSKILTTPFYCPYSNNWLPKSPLVEIVTSFAFIYLLSFVIFFKNQQSLSRSKIGPAFYLSGSRDATALGSGFTASSRYFQI